MSSPLHSYLSSQSHPLSSPSLPPSFLLPSPLFSLLFFLVILYSLPPCPLTPLYFSLSPLCLHLLPHFPSLLSPLLLIPLILPLATLTTLLLLLPSSSSSPSPPLPSSSSPSPTLLLLLLPLPYPRFLPFLLLSNPFLSLSLLSSLISSQLPFPLKRLLLLLLL